MTVHAAVREELKGRTGWQVEMALALAAEIDAKGTASAAKELRGLMADLGSAVKPAGRKETGLSEFEKRLRERESAAKAPRRAGNG